MNYVDYIMNEAKKLIAIPSPSGFTHNAAKFLKAELEEMGYNPVITRKNAVLVDLGGKDKEDAIVLAAHVDTLGAMVTQVKGNGRLQLAPVGGIKGASVEGENCKIHTRDGKEYDATFQILNASLHVNDDFDGAKRNYKGMEALIDEMVSSSEDVEKLGISVGDYVSFDPRTVITKSGYIKSRFLDDKFSSAILMGYAKYLKEENVEPERRIYLLFTSYEEVGHGGAASIPEGVTEMISVDMGCVGDGLGCDETKVSICAMDSVSPYDYSVTSELIRIAKEKNLGFAVDVYPHYGSDVDVTLKAGYDIKHGLIGPGVYASHGYERSHRLGAENTFELLKGYLG